MRSETQFQVVIEGGGTLSTTVSSATRTRPTVTSQLLPSTEAAIQTGGLLTVEADASDSSVVIVPPVDDVLPIMVPGQRNTWVFHVRPADNGDFSIRLVFRVLRQNSAEVLWQSDPEEVPVINLQVAETMNHRLTTYTSQIGIYTGAVAAVLLLLTTVIPTWRSAAGGMLKRWWARSTGRPVPPKPVKKTPRRKPVAGARR